MLFYAYCLFEPPGVACGTHTGHTYFLFVGQPMDDLLHAMESGRYDVEILVSELLYRLKTAYAM